MSEISYEFSNVLTTGDQIDALDNSDRKTDESWDAELYNLVAENAQLLVKCPWLQKSVMTLSEAIIAYPAQLTRESLPLYMSLAYQLLANRVDEIKKPDKTDESEKDEPIESEEPEQESDTETEAQAAQAKPNTDGTDRKPEKASENAKILELPVSRLEATTEPQANYVLAAEVERVAEPVLGEPAKSIQGPAKNGAPATVLIKSAARAEAANTSANDSAGKTNANDSHTTIVSPAKNSTSLRSATKSTAAKTVQELVPIPASADDKLNKTAAVIKPGVEAQAPKTALEIPEPDSVADPAVELKVALDRPAVDTDQEIEAPVLPEILDEVPAPKLTELSILELKSVAATEDTLELSDEIIEAPDVELAPVILEYEAVTDGLINLVEEEVVALDHFEEDVQEFYELDISSIPTWEATTDIGETGEEQSALYINSEPKLSVDLESADTEQLVQNTLATEEIEDSLTQLAERLEAGEPETTEQVNEILDKIIEVPAKLEAHDVEKIISEEGAQGELEELFTELFNKLGLDYTPELIESLTSLTLRWCLTDEIEKLKDEEETDKAAPGSGRHKFIKKLLTGLSIIKKAIAHASAIGKSALQLYNLSFAA